MREILILVSSDDYRQAEEVFNTSDTVLRHTTTTLDLPHVDSYCLILSGSTHDDVDSVFGQLIDAGVVVFGAVLPEQEGALWSCLPGEVDFFPLSGA